MLKNFSIDYKNREVITQNRKIAIIKESENSYFVCSHLYEEPKGHLNYLIIEWFAKSISEAEEKVNEILEDLFL